MSIWHKKFRTNRALWASLSIALFVLMGFVRLTPEGKGAVSYWGMWGVFLSGEWICSPGEFVLFLVVHALIRGVPAVVVAWVLQAVGVAMVTGLQSTARSTR
jgi:hypothetical protein